MKKLIFIFFVFSTISAYCQEIAKIEYSIDKFVAEGNGTSVNVTPNNTNLDSILDISIAELSEGLHIIYFRSQNADGMWSLPVQSSFYISNPDTTTVEKVFYRVYNETYTGEWDDSPVIPSRKHVDSLFAVSTSELNLDEQYSIEFYAVNSLGIRGFSAYLNNIDFVVNSSPESLITELNIEMLSGDVVQVSMDTLFHDIDIPLGDSLIFDLVELDDEQLNEFTSWPSHKVIEFAPGNTHNQTYAFKIAAFDLAGEEVTVETNLIVNNPTDIESNSFTKMEIYPNPASDFLRIRNLNGVGNLEVQISNIQGVIISQQTIEDAKIDISGLETGIYILELSIEEHSLIKKFIVE